MPACEPVTAAGPDGLDLASWECASTSPGAAHDPAELSALALKWIPASVPGTAAGALLADASWRWGGADDSRLDGRDWWFRCRLPAPVDAPACELQLDGLATLADVWLDGEHVLRSENMFVAHRVPVATPAAGAELVLRFAALTPQLRARRPRPRWKSRLVRAQSLRWVRTSLLGRMPGPAPSAAPVGPWRPVRLVAAEPTDVVQRRWLATCDGADGVLGVTLTLRGGGEPPRGARLHAGGTSAPLQCHEAAGRRIVTGTLRLPEVQRWWPHNLGPQPLYPVELEVDGRRLALGRVGFRTIDVDRSDGGFALRVNGVPVFCRGAIWDPPDAISLAAGPDQVRASIQDVRRAGMNMLRVAGYATYEDATFWDACDELGILVWQDCMLASYDPPERPAFVAGLQAELRQVLGALQGRPALATVCGSSETYQQAAMYGFGPEQWESPLLERTIPELVAELLPGVPYLPSTPSGGDLPFRPGEGVAHFFGVGAYMRPPSDARLAGVRFAAECLSFGTPPEPETVEEAFGGASAAGHDPGWKLAVARDAGTSWDFEDVRDHYVRELFEVDPLDARYSDPEWALDLGRAAIAELMCIVMTEWRRPGSSCAGALVLTWQDHWPGAGWGLRDAFGRPKAPLYALRRVLAPTAVLASDEGLGGLRLHVVHDGPEPLAARLRLRLLRADGTVSEVVEREVAVAAHGAVELSAEALLGGFRDITRAYRFGPPAHDVTAVQLLGADGRPLAEAFHLATGAARPRDADLGLRALVRPDGDGSWSVTISTDRFAQYVAIDAPGFRPSDSWFHLAPDADASVSLRGEPGRRPAGTVRALNATVRSPLVVEGDQ